MPILYGLHDAGPTQPSRKRCLKLCFGRQDFTGRSHVFVPLVVRQSWWKNVVFWDVRAHEISYRGNLEDGFFWVDSKFIALNLNVYPIFLGGNDSQVENKRIYSSHCLKWSFQPTNLSGIIQVYGKASIFLGFPTQLNIWVCVDTPQEFECRNFRPERSFDQKATNPPTAPCRWLGFLNKK